ncbi:enoyl-CoA hydratase/isomerase family protein [Emticicia agri]|uniref:Enoyl-CoA hydratase/isomerase family protein n=1 Tax=Emticicia agri TaxID=2492393 RepID=A0A4Q5M0T8_9BACT|nr:enoyl-CoA hydratase/isomerase family protein [Emticicia agri]RYU95778.1 enoyl-CoA hydratase/isomerase family protein [Emticicia agri]
MEYHDIIVEEKEAISIITLNRPASLNALTPLMIVELKHALTAIAKRADIKVVVVKGAGRAFSAGVDLKALNEGIQGGQFKASDILQDGNDIAHILRTMPQPGIVLVHGYCYTGATELMLFFDLIVAAENAKIGDTHTKWGILPKWGMTQRLPKLVGLLKAKELSFTAKPITGKEAESIGLVNRAVPLEKLEETAFELAHEILQNSAQTIAAMKHLYNEGFSKTLEEGLAIEQEFLTEITDRAEFLKNFEKNK